MDKKLGPCKINLGQSSTVGLYRYKKKFINSFEQEHYNGYVCRN